MQQNSDEIISYGHWAVCLAFGIAEKPSGAGGPFSGRHYRPKGQPGGKFRTRAARVHATETVKSGFSSPLLADSQRLTGFIHQWIKELNETEQWWLNICYREPGSLRNESWVHFRNTYCPRYEAAHCSGARPGTRAIVREMIAFRVGQEAGHIPRSAKFESQNGTVSRQAWAKTYEKHWARICDDLDRVGRAALYKIGVKAAHFA